MYEPLLAVHSILRWVVILAGLAAVARAITGWKGRPWTPADDRGGLIFMIALDVQLLLGLALYLIFSPTIQAAVQNVGAAMRDGALRFFLVEHAFGMLIAITLVHIGRIRIRKQSDPTRRHRTAAIFFGLALLIVLLSIPWPGMPAGRPLWP